MEHNLTFRRLIVKYNFVQFKRKENLEGLSDHIEQEGCLVPVKPLKFHLPDPDDEPFLEVALSGGAKAIIMGNKRHFPRKEYEGIRIPSPSEFLEAVKEKI